MTIWGEHGSATQIHILDVAELRLAPTRASGELPSVIGWMLGPPSLAQLAEAQISRWTCRHAMLWALNPRRQSYEALNLRFVCLCELHCSTSCQSVLNRNLWFRSCSLDMLLATFEIHVNFSRDGKEQTSSWCWITDSKLKPTGEYNHHKPSTCCWYILLTIVSNISSMVDQCCLNFRQTNPGCYNIPIFIASVACCALLWLLKLHICWCEPTQPRHEKQLQLGLHRNRVWFV